MALGLDRCLALLIELLLLVVILVLSLTTVTTISLLKKDFRGECPLFPTIKDYSWFNFQTNDVINCNYIIGANAASACIGLLYLIYSTIELVKKKRLISFMPFIKMTLALTLTIFVTVSAGIVTVGFQELCSGLATIDTLFHDYDTCKEWQEDNYWDYIYDYNGSHFYDYLFIAQIATWINTILWISMSVLFGLVLAFCTSRSVDDDDRALIL